MVDVTKLQRFLKDLKVSVKLIEELLNQENLESYILLEAKQHGTYSYPDLLVSMHRLGLTPEVEQVAGKLNLKVSNTAQERDGHQYIGNIQWGSALKLNLLLDGFTLNPRQFFDFKELLEKGIKGKKVYDGSGKLLDSKVLELVHDEIYNVGNPWRSEWLDADFKVVNDILRINYNHKIVNGSLQPQNSGLLEDYLMEDCGGDFKSLNKQGLPIRKGSDFNYRYPRSNNNSVAWFGADSSGSIFLCNGRVDGSDSSLGVRGAKIKE